MQYCEGMTLTATSFRAQLFPTLDSIAQGEDVLITHKGRTFRMIEERAKPRLERMAEIAPLISFPPEDSDSVQSPWDESAWLEKWAARER